MSLPKPWTFLSLPFEIRDAIYHAALSHSSPIYISKPSSAAKSQTLVPNLLLASKQIHHEANLVLYTRNTFTFDTNWRSIRFLQLLGPTKVALLKNIRLEVGSNYDGARTINHIHYTGPVWCELFRKLADEATGLAHFYVSFHIEELVSRGGSNYVGAGNDILFVKTLGDVRVAKEGRMEIDGFFTDRCKRLLEEVCRWPGPVWTEEGKSSGYLEKLRKYREDKDG